MHHFIAIGEFKLELQSGNPNLGQIGRFFFALRPSNFMDDPEKQ